MREQADKPGGKAGSDHGARARRLAEALRENLRRRKAQARARAEDSAAVKRRGASDDDKG